MKRQRTPQHDLERPNSWLKSFRRLGYRVDGTNVSFEAFIYLAVIVICIRRAIGKS